MFFHSITIDTTDTVVYIIVMATKETVRRTVRLTPRNAKKLRSAFAKMYKVEKANSENDVINYLIETYL